jgi:hypothetical protein
MPPQNVDRRLLGTWKSDRRRTLEHFKLKPTAKPRSVRFFKSMFGKMVIHWMPATYRFELDGSRLKGSYEIVAQDSESVVIRTWSDLHQEHVLRQIHFEENYYWMCASGSIIEYFRRISPPSPAQRALQTVERQPSVKEAIRAANHVLPGSPRENAPARWQAVMAVGEHVKPAPEAVWQFVARWGKHPLEDVRDAIATLLLEHLLEHHFALIFPRVEQAAHQNPLFADMFCRCWKFGQSTSPAKARKFDRLQRQLASQATSAGPSPESGARPV